MSERMTVLLITVMFGCLLFTVNAAALAAMRLIQLMQKIPMRDESAANCIDTRT
jgi:hypothetical protein